ncbi:OmpA family protein [Streptomonospora salina]
MQPLTERAAGVAGAAFLTGTPVALARVGWPLAADGVGWAEVVMHLRAFTLPTSLLLAALMCLVAAAWTAYALATVADLLRMVQGQAPRMAVARLAAAVLAATASGTALAAPAAADTASAYSAAQPISAAEHGPDEREHQQDRDRGVHRHRSVTGFALDSADLAPDMRARLDSVAELVRAYGDPDTPITVTGHTDPTGGEDYNLDLSQRRAQAAASYLRTTLGAEFAFTVEGEGEAQPPPHGGDTYAELRRVEIDYRLQPPSKPGPVRPVEKPDHTAAGHEKSAPAAQEREEATSGIAVPAAAATAAIGAAALAGGCALARRSRRHRHTGDGALGPALQDDETTLSEAAAEDEAPAPSRPVEAEASEGSRQVRLGPEVVVDATRGLAITGPDAAGVVAALLARTARQAPGSVIATRSALEEIGCGEDGNLHGVTRVMGTEAALVRAEAYLVAAQRTAEDDAEEETAEVLPTVLVEASGQGAPHERVRAMLAVESATAPTVIALADLGQGTRIHAGDELVRITEADATVREFPADALWRQDGAPAGEPPPAGEHPAPVHPSPAANAGADAPAPRPEAGPGAVVLRLFAPRVDVRAAGSEVTDRMRAAARLLLAYLAIHPDGATGEEISELLAPGASPARARSARNNALSSARSAIRAALGAEEMPVVETVGGRYRLQKELFDVDLRHFNDALDRAKTTSGDARAENRRTALAYYVGELLSDITETWVETERHRCRRSAAQTCVRLAEETTAVADKVSLLDRACTIDAYNEMVHRMLAEAYAENNDPDAVHRTYQRLSENLRGIGERPSKEVRARVENLTSIAPLRSGAPR